ncbi:helix-turn-helix domain-containing protein [Xanthomonas theicola]|uniref:helix-turn-helix domain-containing protein n=1 Tax=Xanthomonas theicola TaxID=56464 RepID=UPI00361459A3
MLAAEGATNAQIAQQCGISLPMIMHWKKRFAEHKLAGLHDQAKSGRPRTHGDEAVAALLNQVLSSLPETATHWSVRAASRVSGISRARWRATSTSLACSRIAASVSSSPTIRTSWPSRDRCGTELIMPPSGAAMDCGADA